MRWKQKVLWNDQLLIENFTLIIFFSKKKKSIFLNMYVRLFSCFFTEPYVTYWRDESTLLQIRTPSGDGNVLHKYNSGGLLLRTASGDSLSLYEYNDENLLTGVTHTRESKFTLKITLVRNIVNLPKGKYIQIQSRTNAYSRLPFYGLKTNYFKRPCPTL